MIHESRSAIWNRCGQRAIAGDAEAMGDLLTTYRPLMISMARRQVSKRVQSIVGASDIVQVTCAEAHAAVRELRANSGNQFRCWLLRLLRNNMIDIHRRFVGSQKSSKLREVSECQVLFLIDSKLPAPSEELLRQEERELLYGAIERLAPVHCEVLKWHLIDGMSDEDIAASINRSRNAVRMLLGRAKTALRKEVLAGFR